MRPPRLLTLAPMRARAGFPIPMRGNELRVVSAQPAGRAFRFPIPMRGNELQAFVDVVHTYGLFPIPMRGRDVLLGAGGAQPGVVRLGDSDDVVDIRLPEALNSNRVPS